MAERAASLDWLQKQRQNVFNLAQRSQNQAYGAEVDKGLIESDEEMAVSVGDYVVNNYPEQPKSQDNSFLKSILPVLLGGALTLGGFALANYFDSDDTDTDTQVDFEIVHPKEDK